MALAALMMVAMIGFAGLVIDGGREYLRYRESQNTADAAALAAVYAIAHSTSPTVDAVCAQAIVVLQQNNFSSSHCNGTDGLTLTLLDEKDSSLTWATTSLPKTLDVQADVTSTLPTVLMRVLGLFNQSVAATARARVGDYYWCELCVLAPTGSGALKLNGNGGFTATNVKVVVDSSDSAALDANNGGAQLIDNNTLGTASVDVVGGVSAVGIATNGTVTNATTANITGNPAPAINTGIPPVPDPLYYIAQPTTSTIYSTPGASSVSITSNGGSNLSTSNTGCATITSDASGAYTCTINPGVYSSIKDTSNVNLVLSPGVYILTGLFNVTGTGNVTANGVMLYFTCASGSGNNATYTACTSTSSSNNQSMGALNLAGSGTITMSAMSSNSYDSNWNNLLVFYDRLDTQTLSITGNGSTTTNITSTVAGTLYAKDSTATLAGSGSMASQYDALTVVNNLNIGGSTGSNSMSLTFDQNKNVVPRFGSGLVN